MSRSRGGRWSCSASLTSLANTSSPPSIELSPDSIRSSVVLPEPLRPDSVSRSRRSTLNETPRRSGSPAMSLPRSDPMQTAIASDPRSVALRGDTPTDGGHCRCVASRRMDFGVGYFPTHDGMSPGAVARLVEERGQSALFFAEHSHIPASRESRWAGGSKLPQKYWHSYDLFVALTTAAEATS